jgi:hypothetical protein
VETGLLSTAMNFYPIAHKGCGTLGLLQFDVFFNSVYIPYKSFKKLPSTIQK